MKKLVFDKQEVVHIDSLTEADTVMGFKDGCPAVVIFNTSKDRWSYFGYTDGSFYGNNWPFNDLINDELGSKGITDFYVV